jgi:hypothetical protein
MVDPTAAYSDDFLQYSLSERTYHDALSYDASTHGNQYMKKSLEVERMDAIKTGKHNRDIGANEGTRYKRWLQSILQERNDRK